MIQLFQITDKLGTHLLRVVMDELRHQTVVFKDLSEADQEQRAMYLQQHINQAAAHAAKQLMAGGFPAVTAKLKKITVEDGVNAQLTFGNEELHALSDAVGTMVVLVLVDPQTHASAVDDLALLVDKDQGELPLAGVDDYVTMAADPDADPPSSAREEDHSQDDDPMFAEVE